MNNFVKGEVCNICYLFVLEAEINNTGSANDMSLGQGWTKTCEIAFMPIEKTLEPSIQNTLAIKQQYVAVFNLLRLKKSLTNI